MLTRPLPRRVRHKELETGLSLALRLAHRHGESWKVFAGATGLPISGLRMSEHLRELAACSSVPAERLHRWTPRWMGHDVEVLGHRFDRSRFLRLNLRVCPHCMEEDMAARAGGERAEDAAYLRLEWCLAFVFGCEHHRVRLISRCPKCGERPKWNVGRIDACHCGASLLGQRPEGLTGDELAILRTLRDRLHGRVGKHDRISATRDVPLADLVNLLRLLGQVSHPQQHASNAACAIEVENLSDLLVHGSRVLEALPGSFERVLDTLAGQGLGRHRGVTEVYGLPLVRWMRSDRPFIEVLRPIFDRHAAQNARLPKRATPDEPLSLYRRRMARSRRFLTPSEMKRLEDAVDWKGAHPATRAEVVALVPEALVHQQTAAAYLGVAVDRFWRLRQTEIVKAIWSRDGYEPQHFYRAELDALLDRLCGSAMECEKIPPSLMALPQLAQKRAVEISSLIIELLEGRVECRGVLAGARGLKAILLDPKDVQCRRNKPPPGAISKSNTRKFLGLDAEAWAAVNGVMLMSARSGARTYVDWAAIEGFDRTWISTTRIGTLLGFQVAKVRSCLAAQHVSSVASGVRFAIYSRADAEAVFPDLMGRFVNRASA